MSQSNSEPALIAYRVHDQPSMPIVPAPLKRQWMEETRDRFAYRCLPLNIANQHGWFVLNEHRIKVIWNGGERLEDLTVICKSGPQNVPSPALSHFGHGVLTFHIGYLFRTPPGYNLWARGPANWPKAGISPLEGIIETDWTVATFTMNWKLTAINTPVEFEPGEPICMILPVQRGEVEAFVPQFENLSAEPQLKQAFNDWAASRDQFNRQLRVPNSEAEKQKWQREYIHGLGPGGIKAPEHQLRLELREFSMRDGDRPGEKPQDSPPDQKKP